MNNLWLKIKVTTKITIFAILCLAVLIFVFQNVNKPAKLWLWNEIDTTLLKVLFGTALISAILTFLVGTAFRTIRQIRELKSRSRAEKLEREVADMKAKAAMLKTKPVAGAEPAPSVTDVAPSPSEEHS
jgi:uncharacterized integral membrane protein